MVYEGEFRNEKPCGRGVLYQPNGASVYGRWVEGKLVPTV